MPLAFLASGGERTLTAMYGFHGNSKCNDIFKEKA
jgi:hypothetical protein